jgi:hypothetical protein
MKDIQNKLQAKNLDNLITPEVKKLAQLKLMMKLKILIVARLFLLTIFQKMIGL